MQEMLLSEARATAQLANGIPENLAAVIQSAMEAAFQSLCVERYVDEAQSQLKDAITARDLVLRQPQASVAPVARPQESSLARWKA